MKVLPYWLSRLIHKMSQLIYWMPIIYKSNDWEFESAIELFRLKVQKVREYIDYNRFHVGDEAVVKQMKEFEKALQRLELDEYFESMPAEELRVLTTKQIFEKEAEMRRKDIQMIMYYWEQYSRRWWS